MIRRLLLLLALIAAPAGAALTERDLAQAVARPAENARRPDSIAFADDRGGRVTLAQVAGGRPLVLLFADYTCRHICGPGLALTAGALHDSGLVAGRNYRVAVIGLDPRDGIGAARAMARNIVDPDVRGATALLVGDPRGVAAAEHALGYGTAYDAEQDQFAHDASIYVFARDGRLSALLPELGLRPEALKAAIQTDAPLPQASFGEQVAHLCYGLAAVHGRYGRPAVLAMQAMALALAAAGGAWAWRRRRVAV